MICAEGVYLSYHVGDGAGDPKMREHLKILLEVIRIKARNEFGKRDSVRIETAPEHLRLEFCSRTIESLAKGESKARRSWNRFALHGHVLFG